MFSPSLLSAMLHSVWSSDADAYPTLSQIKDYDELIPQWQQIQVPPEGWPFIPVVGRTRRFDDIASRFELERANFTEGAHGMYFWKRISWDRLRDHFEDKWSDANEYLDLGSTIQTCSTCPTTAKEVCEELLQKCAHENDEFALYVCIVDEGVVEQHAVAETFGGYLHQVIPSDIKMSPHALSVLSVLLQRLDSKKLLNRIRVVSCLVGWPHDRIGMDCFDHAGAVEMRSAVEQLRQFLSKSDKPAVVSMSLVTHVGPHNDASPLEESIASVVNPAAGRIYFVAVGNDGLSGRVASHDLQKETPEFLRIQTGSQGCKELLVEFWWQEQSPKISTDLEVGFDIASANSRIATFQIDRTYRGHVLRSRTPVNARIVRGSVFQERVRSDMSCIVLLLSSMYKDALKSLKIDITLVAKHDVMVNSWIVECTDKATIFLGGRSTGTVAIPATSSQVIGVSAVDRNGTPWGQASRGIVGRYKPNQQGQPSPRMAHHCVCSIDSKEGTSFASPRAAADLAAIFLAELKSDSSGFSKMLKQRSLDDWVNEILKENAGKTGAWNPRTGLGSISTP